MKRGAGDFIEKPFDVEAVRRMLRSAVERASLLEAASRGVPSSS